MKLLTVILNYNTPDMTTKAIAAAVDAMVAIPDSKIIVVDNASTDDSYNILQSRISENQTKSPFGWNKVTISLSEKNGGFGAGNNLAIKKHLDGKNAADLFYILNSDAFPDKAAVKTLLDYMESNPQTGFAGSYIYGPDGEPHTTAFRYPSIFGEFEGAMKLGPISRLLKKYVVPLGIPSKTMQVDWLAGASMMIRGSTLNEIGLFDENFFLYYEETDLCRRGLHKGWKTDYVKESTVCHIGSVSTGMKVVERMPQYWFDSRRHYFKKNHGAFYYYTATLLRALGEIGYRVRVKIERKEHGEPKKFISDLILHALAFKR